MQTTLLGLAIAFILALLAALIGPYFVDWNQFRPQFEAEATRILGTQVRVTGAMDARLLPVPSLRLQSVAVGGANDPARLGADRFDVEFSLGAMMRGEVRATDLTINGVSLDLGIDDKGQLDWPALGNVDLRTAAIEKLNLTGRLALHDAASKTTLELEDIAFAGDVRSAAGALRGDGNFTLTGTRYPFRLNINAQPDQPGSRVRLTIDASAVPLMIEVDGIVTAEARRPRFEGGLVLARPQRPNTNDPLPWRMAAKLKADPTAAAFEQIDVAIGGDESGVKFSGSGDMRFGALPFLRANLAAKSLDGDKLLGTSGPAMTLLPGLADALSALPQWPFAADVSTSVEQIMLAGRPVQDIGVDLRTAGRGWNVSKLEFRGPGATRVGLAGAFSGAQASGFDGRVNLVSTDPDAFVNWLQGRGDGAIRWQKPLRIGGQMKLAPGRIALDGMSAEIDGGIVKGRLTLLRPEKGASRIEAVLQADRLDIDAALAMLRATGQGSWPDEGQVALDIAQALAGGQEMKPFGVAFGYDAQRITLERLRVGEASGITLDGSGQFDRKAATGTVTLNAAAPSLARIAALAEPYMPMIAARIAPLGKNDGPAKLSLALGVENDTAKADRVKARATLGIEASSLKGSFALNAEPQAALVRAWDTDKLRQSELTVDGRLTATRGRTLTALLGLDTLIAAGDAPLTFETNLTGGWTSAWRGSAKLSGTTLDADVNGTGEPSAEPRNAALRVAVRKVNLSPLLGTSADDPLARDASLTAKLAISGDRYAFDTIDGTLAGARVRGRATVTMQDVKAVDGELGLDKLDLAPVFAMALGSAGREAGDPFGTGWGSGWQGRIGFMALRGLVPGGIELQSLSGVLRNDGDALRLENLKAKIGGGDATGDIEARRSIAGLSLTAKADLKNVDGGALTYRGLSMPAAKAGLRVSLASQGRSASALASALSGEGLVTLSSVRLNGLDPKAIGAAIAASDQARIGDDVALRRIVEPALASGAMNVAQSEIPFVVKDGRLRVNATPMETAEIRAIVSGGYDITADQADIRVTLAALNQKGAGNSLPELQIFSAGPPDRMTRAVDVAPLSSWLAIRSIDRETKRLDALEKGNPLPSVAAVPPPANPAPAPTTPAPAELAPIEVVPSPMPRPRIAPPPQPSAQNLAPALPPAIEIGPPPGTPRRATPAPRPPTSLVPSAAPRSRTLDAFQ